MMALHGRLPEALPWTVAVASLSQAKRHKRLFDAIITLEDPKCRPTDRLRFVKRPSPPHLVLCFEDVDDDSLGIRVATRDEVFQTLDFARQHAAGSLLVHCHHGVGRSAAIALAILADRLGPGREAGALEELLRIRPESSPNRVVIAHADSLLSRDGALVAAVDAWEAETPRIIARRQAKLKHLKTFPGEYTWLPKPD